MDVVRPTAWPPVWVVGLVAVPVFLLLRSILSFFQNYRAARQTGLPVICSPIAPFNPVWLILGPHLGPIIRKAPFGLGSWVYYTRYVWLWEDQDQMHQKLGKVFIHVTPGSIEFYIADLEAIRQVYARKKAFERSQKDHDNHPVLLSPSVSSVSGAEWQRHRRITAPPFNERNMKLVWDESLRQASDMSQWWFSNGPQGFKSPCRDTMTLALNVLALAGLGLSWDFLPAGQEAEGEDEFSTMYRNSLAPLLTNIVMLSLAPQWLYDYGPRFAKYLPQTIADHVLRAQKFRSLMRQLVDERRAEVKAGKVKDYIFLNAIIAKSEEMQQQSDAKSDGLGTGDGLSEAELFANIVDYNIAGHETTAHTMNYCFHILGVHPEWQEWIQQEVDYVFPDLPLELANVDYEQTFYKLKRCLALMFEMLRKFPPVTLHGKECLAPKGEGHELQLNNRKIFVPGGSKLHLTALSVHLLPEYWGADSHEWKPTRWIQARENKGEDIGDILESEALVPPPVAKESFFPWSLGARDCPGKKFAQVEFVAVMAYILRHYRVEAVPFEGETVEDTRKRIWDYTKDSVAAITINFREPDKYALRLVKRT